MRHPLATAVCVLLLLTATAAAQNRRDEAVRKDKEKIEADESWIYNDLNDGRAQAKAENKPLMVLIRCIP